MNEPYFWDIGAFLIIRKLIKPEINMMYQYVLGFRCGSAGKESACNEGDLSSIPGLGRSPGEGKVYIVVCVSEKAMAPHSSTLA